MLILPFAARPPGHDHEKQGLRERGRTIKRRLEGLTIKSCCSLSNVIEPVHPLHPWSWTPRRLRSTLSRHGPNPRVEIRLHAIHYPVCRRQNDPVALHNPIAQLHPLRTLDLLYLRYLRRRSHHPQMQRDRQCDRHRDCTLNRRLTLSLSLQPRCQCHRTRSNRPRSCSGTKTWTWRLQQRSWRERSTRRNVRGGANVEAPRLDKLCEALNQQRYRWGWTPPDR